MDNNTSLVAFGTFGNPNGFRQTFFTGNRELSKSVKTFDLNTNAIKLFPNAKLYSIRKEYAGGYNIVSYSAYSFAKEQNSDRSGTFIGTGILFTNKIAEENITINLLNEFQESLINKYVQNDVITVNHSDQFRVSKPKDFDKTEYYLKSIEDLNFIQSFNKTLVIYCETSPNRLQPLLKSSIDLLNVYDTIYYTQSHEVAEFVAQKGIFKLIQANDFEKEIQNLQEERNRKRESSISEFEKEIQKLDDDKNKMLNDFKEQIEQNEKLHLENENTIRESKNDLENVKQIYNDFSSGIKDLVNQLKSGRKLDEVKQIQNENKRRFIDGVNQLKKPNYVNKISKANAKSGLRTENHYEHEHNRHQNRKRGEIEEPKIDLFKVATFVLLVLLIGTWVYFLFLNTKEESQPVQAQQQEIPVQPESTPTQTTTTPVRELNPKPNSELNENGYRLAAKSLKYNIKADDVVKIIFDKNPTEIKSNYIGQEDIYAKQIIELNKSCFEEKDGIFYFSKDTLRHIPSYKK